MTYAPDTLQELAAYWTAHGGESLGIVGNARHRVGYHLGRDRIFDGPTGPGIGARDYSVELERDRAGLTNGAAAIDFGELDGSLDGLRQFSRWLVARCLVDPETRADIREVIYTPDGATVQRYSSVDNAIHTGPGNGDDSHLRHTHVSYYRDSEARDKIAAIRPYFEEVSMIVPMQLAHVRVANTAGAHLFSGPDVDTELPTVLPLGSVWRKYGGVTGWQFIEVNYGQPVSVPTLMWVKSIDVVFDPLPLTVIDGPPPAADCDAEQAKLDSWDAWYALAPHS